MENQSMPKASYWRNWLPSRGSVLLACVSIGISLLAYAQSVGAFPTRAPTASTNTIAYQGRLTDTSGLALTGTYTMTFRLYNVASGGSALWTENLTGGNSVAVNGGLFNVLLGSLTPIPQSVITGNNNLWLGVKVGTDSEMMPRVQLGSVPFAVQALTVPAGAITSDKLALPSGSVCLSADVAVPVTGSYTRAVIPGASVPLTLTTSGKVLIWTSGSYNFTTPNYYVGTAVFLDGAELVNTDEYAPYTAWSDFALIRQVTIAAGAHTLDLRTFAQNVGTMTYSGSGQETCLQYVVLN